MKISQKIRAEHGGGSSAVEAEFEAEALAGTAEKSAEFAAQGNRVCLPLADLRRPAGRAAPGGREAFPEQCFSGGELSVIRVFRRSAPHSGHRGSRSPS
ncbi:hypothetical protein [Kitasatospora sp. NPDC098663]|uniref:hypothetical protein n=1 Tax=Kitasatospora sp. NPDC098663 TaxID=3364096 RepID=UPI003821DA93